jgi:cell division protein FtsX
VRTLLYAWEEALVSLRRGRWGLLLSVSTIAVAFAILGAFLVVSDNIGRVAEGWTSSAELSVYLDDVVTDTERTAIRQVLDRDPVVTSSLVLPTGKVN